MLKATDVDYIKRYYRMGQWSNLASEFLYEIGAEAKGSEELSSGRILIAEPHSSLFTLNS